MNVFEATVLLATAFFAFTSAAIALIGSRAIASRSKRASVTALKDLLANDYYEAVCVLVPAYDAQDTIVDTVKSLLNLQHPQFDITVVNDGSNDATLGRLASFFDLVEVPIAHDGGFETAPLRAMFRSTGYANLTVIDKEHGGRADALNAGLNLSRRALVCVVDAGVVLEPHALAAPSRRFVEDESVVAVTGLVRPDDSSPYAPPGSSWARRIQVAEHARRTVAAAGWAAIGGGMDVDGFAIFRRRSLQEIGGWTKATDVETLLGLHRIDRARKQPYRIVHTTDTVGHKLAEPTIARTFSRRGRRLRALAGALWAQRRMFLRRQYGRVGFVAMPVRAASEIVMPFVDVAAYGYLIVGALTGSFDLAFAAAFAALAVCSRILVSHLATTVVHLAPHEDRHRVLAHHR